MSLSNNTFERQCQDYLPELWPSLGIKGGATSVVYVGSPVSYPGGGSFTPYSFTIQGNVGDIFVIEQSGLYVGTYGGFTYQMDLNTILNSVTTLTVGAYIIRGLIQITSSTTANIYGSCSYGGSNDGTMSDIGNPSNKLFTTSVSVSGKTFATGQLVQVNAQGSPFGEISARTMSVIKIEND